MPQRLQRHRARGWRKPTGSVCVTRGTIWGNPFVVDPDRPAGSEIGITGYWAVPTVEDAIACYRVYLDERPDLVQKAKRRLRGKNLLCWCKVGDPCHADVLLEVANGAP